jgi:hypothetical protein
VTNISYGYDTRGGKPTPYSASSSNDYRQPPGHHGAHGGASSGGFRPQGNDWICPAPLCSAHNFGRRTNCFLCQTPRSDTPSIGRVEDPNTILPINVLAVRPLTQASTDESVRSVFVACPGLKDVKVALDRDHSTGATLPSTVAYLEFDDLKNAAATLTMTASATVLVDGNNVRVTYARRDEHPFAHMAPLSTGSSSGAPPRPPQLAPGFEWDRHSGYWYDKSSGFYFDATSQLYSPGGQSELFYRWDLTTGQYVQVDSRGVRVDPIALQQAAMAAAAAAAQAAGIPPSAMITNANDPSAAVAIPGVSSTIPAAVAALMEPKEPKKKALPSGPLKFTIKAGAAPAKATASGVDLQRWNQRKDEVTPTITTTTPAASATGIAAGGAPPGAPASYDPWLDEVKIICKLCQRKLGSIEQLRKHASGSELHKKNLEVEQYKRMARDQRSESEQKLERERRKAEAEQKLIENKR